MNRLLRVSFCCRDCRKRIFDYHAGTLNITMKCERCKRILSLKNINESYVTERMENGKLFI